MLGLKHGHNILVRYDPEWRNAFTQERDRIVIALRGVAKAVEHYGSTAVEGMTAKPIIDILVGVAPLTDWERCKKPLEQVGYDYAANAGVFGHHIFGRGNDATDRTHLIHVVDFYSSNWSLNLAFRDALRSDAQLRAAYEAEKERAVALAPQDRPKYNKSKADFVARAKMALSRASN